MERVGRLQARIGAAWQLVGPITRRSKVQILHPLPDVCRETSENESVKTCVECGSEARNLRRGLCYLHYMARYRALNRDVLNARNRAWRAANLEKARASSEAWRLANLERSREKSRRWLVTNREAAYAIGHAYRVRERNAKGRYTAAEIVTLYQRQRGRCACCHADLAGGFHRDHILPLTLGGSGDIGNIQLLCATCNISKNCKHPVDFMQSRGFLL